jgi:hypothetical protein
MQRRSWPAAGGFQELQLALAELLRLIDEDVHELRAVRFALYVCFGFRRIELDFRRCAIRSRDRHFMLGNVVVGQQRRELLKEFVDVIQFERPPKHGE